MLDNKELNEKDLHCIARHIKAYTEQEIRIIRASNPCRDCNYCKEKRVINPFESFKKIFHITGL
ncbi:MAG: hypothetical protein ACM3KR_00125 [Deltaproteobacteria bacterium]